MRRGTFVHAGIGKTAPISGERPLGWAIRNWHRLRGADETFLDWLAPQLGQRWLDVGCGNGAFTEMLIGRRHPASVHGVDPSEEQLAYARMRPALCATQLQQGNAMALADRAARVRSDEADEADEANQGFPPRGCAQLAGTGFHRTGATDRMGDRHPRDQDR
ncbi:methyltransferase domain-containing protein [Xanthomonas theicola]|nr:methyltransferase domain-containing protein [Xanthomonas theicola]